MLRYYYVCVSKNDNKSLFGGDIGIRLLFSCFCKCVFLKKYYPCRKFEIYGV